MGSEVWKPIRGYEGVYEVSDMGRVRSLDRILKDGRKWKGRVIATSRDTFGYKQLVLCNVERHSFRIHVLVAEAFCAGKGVDKEVCHVNGDKTDNRASNLAWKTRYENVQDSIRHDTWSRGERNGHAKLTEDQAKLILNAGKLVKADVWADEFGVAKQTINDIQCGRGWRHLQEGPKVA